MIRSRNPHNAWVSVSVASGRAADRAADVIAGLDEAAPRMAYSGRVRRRPVTGKLPAIFTSALNG